MRTGGLRLKIQKFKSNKVEIKNLSTNECRDADIADVTQRIQTGQIVIEGASTELLIKNEITAKQSNEVFARGESPAATLEMISLYKWVKALRKAGYDLVVDKPWVRAAMRRLEKNEMLSVKKYSIYALIKADRKLRASNDDVLSLLPTFALRGGRGIKRTEQRTEKFITNEIERLKDKSSRNEQIIFKNIQQTINANVRQNNRDYPENESKLASLSTVTRRVKAELGAKEISLRNRGFSITKKNYRENAYGRDTAEFPLEVVEYDDKRTGVFLVSENTGLPWGQAFVTSGIDQATLSIMGCDLSHQYRSMESAMGAILHTLLPKSNSDVGMEHCQLPWLQYGRPGTILLDNARYNFSKGMRKQSEVNGFILASAQPYTPTTKSSIEHFNDRIGNEFCPRVPGWRGEKGDVESIKMGMNAAILFVDQFKQLFYKWITETYSIDPGEMGLSPNERWTKFYSKHQPAVRWSKDQLSLMRLIPIQLKFRDSGGLERQNLRYQSLQLSELRQRLGFNAKVQAFRDPQDLSYLIVVSPFSNTYFKVQCSEKPSAYEGVTEYQQMLIRKLLRDRGVIHPSIEQLAEGRRSMVQLTADLSKSNKLNLRHKSERTGFVRDEVELNFATGEAEINQADAKIIKQTSEVITELEYEIQQLESISIDPGDESWM